MAYPSFRSKNQIFILYHWFRPVFLKLTSIFNVLIRMICEGRPYVRESMVYCWRCRDKCASKRMCHVSKCPWFARSFYSFKSIPFHAERICQNVTFVTIQDFSGIFQYPFCVILKPILFQSGLCCRWRFPRSRQTSWNLT